MPNMLVVGSVAYDTVDTPSGKNENQLGGSATYFSVASSYLTDVAVVAVVGGDFDPGDRSMLSDRGIDTSGLAQTDGNTFRWSGSYREDLNSAVTLETQLNVFADFAPELGDSHRSLPYLFLANIDPNLQASVLSQMSARPKMVACDTMNLWIDIARPALVSLIAQVDVLMINEAEALQLTERDGVAAAATSLLENGPSAVVIKRGEYGAVVFHRDFTFAVPAYPLVSVVDPTGAGDSFAGGFLGYLSSVDDTGNDAIRRAAVVGSVMASFAVESYGMDRLRSLSASDIDARFNAFVELTRFHPLGGGQGLPVRPQFGN
ncbi:MAG: PfkB family carbohydrate kinase [Dehalococcoidia bacterium]|jgi:sugar/nucleoside kinase (ribokinase family)|nr:PfkB family carbohydrate kinase [Dehalococcoidia bacterium]